MQDVRFRPAAKRRPYRKKANTGDPTLPIIPRKNTLKLDR